MAGFRHPRTGTTVFLTPLSTAREPESVSNPKPKSLREAGRNLFNLGHNDLANYSCYSPLQSESSHCHENVTQSAEGGGKNAANGNKEGESKLLEFAPTC